MCRSVCSQYFLLFSRTSQLDGGVKVRINRGRIKLCARLQSEVHSKSSFIHLTTNKIISAGFHLTFNLLNLKDESAYVEITNINVMIPLSLLHLRVSVHTYLKRVNWHLKVVI